MSYATFEAEIGKINDILCVVNLLNWDARTVMPSGGLEARGRHIATLTGLARDLATGETLQRAIEQARNELQDAPADDMRRQAVEHAACATATLARIPGALVCSLAELKTQAHAAWADARATSNFAGFAPVLERMMDMQRQIAAAIGYEDHPYDALISAYEPQMTWRRLQVIYAELRQHLLPLLERARALPARHNILERSYPVASQRAFSSRIAARFGYDFERGRLDDTLHPFEISFTRSDVRITGRFRENWLPGGLFAVWHEAGHGIYEQGVSEDLTRSTFTTDFINLYAVGGTSFGMHESQSRLWENRVGRSRRFWELHFEELKNCFPQQLADVQVDDFWREINAANPGFIRVEADELTYDLHIMLRSEIEAGLITGDIPIKDLPEIWNSKIEAYLGLQVPNDTLGVLQDVHWSSGMVGSFPTYTLGNIMSSQLFAAAQSDSAVMQGLDNGNYTPLKIWLNQNVHRHGRSKSSDQILMEATGSGLSTAHYCADLARKVVELEN